MFIRPMISANTCLESATYASTAAAEASGDNWCDGARITITSGPVLIYHANLAQDGYSGLIHEEPYGSSNGTLDDSTYHFSEAEGVDPDDWGNAWVDSSTGAKDVFYSFDTDGGLARINDLFSGGQYSGRAQIGLTYPAIGSVSQGFIIRDKVSVNTSGATSNLIYGCRMYLSVNIDGANYSSTFIGSRRNEQSTNWEFYDGTTDYIQSGVSRVTPTRIYHYQKDQRSTVWFGDEATPSINQATTGTGASSIGISTTYRVGGLDVSWGVGQLKMGTQVAGAFTTV